MNMHPHAWPLYNITSLLNIRFYSDGFTIKPVLPFEEYSFKSPLLGYEKSKTTITGWYKPIVDGSWKIRIELNEAEISQFTTISVNGTEYPLAITDNSIEFSGNSTKNSPLKWRLQ
jgi:hypothetical protein